MTQKTKTYVFIRANGFYPLELENDAAAKANAELNPGTRRVETTDGKTVWTERSAAQPNAPGEPSAGKPVSPKPKSL